MPLKRRLTEGTNAAESRVAAGRNAATVSAKRRKVKNPGNISLPSTFLRLPREIRDLVYHEIWRTKLPFTITNQNSEFMVEYEIPSIEGFQVTLPGLETRSRKWAYPAPWFLANKQILKEAIEQFQHKAKWLFLNDHHTKTHISSLLNPWTTHTLELGEIRIAEQQYLLPNGRSIASRVDLRMPIISPLRIRNNAFVNECTIRNLGFTLDISSIKSIVAPDRQVDIDLRPLPSLALPSLTRVAITLRFGKRWSAREDDNAVKPKIIGAVEELGPLLLRGRAKMELHRCIEKPDVWAYIFCKTS